MGAGIRYAISFTGGSFSASSDTWSGSGTVNVAGASITAKSLKAAGASVVLGSGTLTSPTGTSTVGSLSLAGGTLSVAGTLEVTSSFGTSGSPTLSGTGTVVVESGASGVLDDPDCSRLMLSEAKFVNEGSLTMGASGGSLDDSVTMQDGARFENMGTFHTDAYESECGPESNGYSLRNGGGSASSIVNTGTFDVNIGSIDRPPSEARCLGCVSRGMESG